MLAKVLVLRGCHPLCASFAIQTTIRIDLAHFDLFFQNCSQFQYLDHGAMIIVESVPAEISYFVRE